MPTPAAAVAIDVGGTKVAVGLVTADGRIVDQAVRPTPATDIEALTDLIIALARELCVRHDLGPLPVGVGAAGTVDLDGVVRYAPNIRWRDYPLRARLAAALQAPVTVENDASAAGWGEYRAGAGLTALRSMVMLTIGTGVGGGLVLEDRLVRGEQGMSAEFGHIVLSEGGPPCNCGNRGDLEALASGTAIGRMAAEAVAGGALGADSLLHGTDLSGRAVTAAAQAGDAAAARILGQAGFWLGVGIASLVNALDPERVVVGGGAVEAGDLLLAPARDAAQARIMGRGHRRVPPIVPAVLGPDAGLVGAGLLALGRAAPALQAAPSGLSSGGDRP